MNVWKIGSRWGNLGKSVLELFSDYECVFFGNCYGPKIGDWEIVRTGDYFIICDGSIPVALGKSVGEFKAYEDSGFHFTAKEYNEFIKDQDVVICPAKIVIIPKEERMSYPGTHRQNRFCHYNNAEVIENLCSRWKKLSRKGDFKIIPRTTSLFTGKECIFASNIKYRIPVFQRPYSWGEGELRKLMESLHESVKMNESIFMGTMQLSQPIPLNPDGTKNSYKIIDGQQRITTFIILCNVLEKLLGKNVAPYTEAKMRTSVSRGEEQIKLDEYSAFISGLVFCQDIERNPYIRNYKSIENLLAEYFSPSEADDKRTTKENLYNFIKSDKINFVVIETHAGLSKTLQIFDTINTAGMDLDASDLFKIRFYEYLKNQGEQDQIFDQISDIYARIEEYNRVTNSSEMLAMHDILRTYQRIIAAREGLPQSVFSKSYETFFEELFDTLLGIHTHDEFKMLDASKIILSIADLQNIINCYKENFEIFSTDWHFRIISNMIWETRYGNTAWDLPIIARFFAKIERNQIFEFTLCLFKLLCPPSLYYGRRIYAADSALIEVCRNLTKEDGMDILRHCLTDWSFDGGSLEKILNDACELQVAFTPKWKNLICRLVEYLKSESKGEALCKRLWSDIDIEHIQSYTDETDAEKIRTEWEEELNRSGNLVLLESSINRSIKNHKGKKKEAYKDSTFTSVKELADCVDNWTREKAEARRKENTEMIKAFLLNWKRNQ